MDVNRLINGYKIRLKSNKLKVLMLFLLSLSLTESTFADDVHNTIAGLTLDWNTANNSRDIHSLKKMYAATINVRGTEYSLSAYMEKKEHFFQNKIDFNQRIVSDFTVSDCGNDIFKCFFIKEGSRDGSTARYPSYLIFSKVGSSFKIIEEGDGVANSNKNYQTKIGSKSVTVGNSTKVVNQEIESTKKTKNNWTLYGGGLIAVIASVGYFVRKKNKEKTKNEVMPQVNNIPENKASAIKQVSNNYDEFTDENVKKGRMFEEFVVKKFDKEYFKIMIWQSDKSIEGMHADANQDPDLVVRLTKNSGYYKFAVECKYRTKIETEKKFEIITNSQFLRYKKYGLENNMPVFIVLGVGGTANNPNELFIIPLKDLEDSDIKYAYIKKYQQDLGRKFYYNSHDEVLALNW